MFSKIAILLREAKSLFKLSRSGTEIWEGQTMNIETRGFKDRFWMSNGGLPHTEDLRLLEKISRPDYYTLKYEVTIDDPGAYTKPWTSSWTLSWIPGDELPIYYCQDNRQ